MPIDPSISLQVRPLQVESPLNNLARVMQIRQMQQQGDLGELQMQQIRQGIERQNQLRQLLGGFAPEMKPEEQAAQLTRGGYLPEAQSVTKTAAEAAKLQREGESAKLDNTLKKFRLGTQILSSVTDENTYQQARQIAAQNGFDPLPPNYDPAWVQQNLNIGLDYTKRLEEAARQRSEALTRRGQDVTMRGQDIGAQTAAARLRQERENAAQGVTYQTDEAGNIVALPTKLPAGAPAIGRPAVGPEGKPIMSGGKPLTDAQAKAALFGTRMQEANKIFDALEKTGTTTSIPGSRAGMGVGAVISALSPSDQQQLDQAKRDFVNAVLRRESGAVISDSEFANAEKQYFPQIGDSPKVIAQKKQNRAIAQRGVMAEVPQGKRASISAEITGTPATGVKFLGFE